MAPCSLSPWHIADGSTHSPISPLGKGLVFLPDGSGAFLRPRGGLGYFIDREKPQVVGNGAVNAMDILTLIPEVAPSLMSYPRGLAANKVRQTFAWGPAPRKIKTGFGEPGHADRDAAQPAMKICRASIMVSSPAASCLLPRARCAGFSKRCWWPGHRRKSRFEKWFRQCRRQDSPHSKLPGCAA